MTIWKLKYRMLTCFWYFWIIETLKFLNFWRSLHCGGWRRCTSSLPVEQSLDSLSLRLTYELNLQTNSNILSTIYIWTFAVLDLDFGSSLTFHWAGNPNLSSESRTQCLVRPPSLHISLILSRHANIFTSASLGDLVPFWCQVDPPLGFVTRVHVPSRRTAWPWWGLLAVRKHPRYQSTMSPFFDDQDPTNSI